MFSVCAIRRLKVGVLVYVVVYCIFLLYIYLFKIMLLYVFLCSCQDYIARKIAGILESRAPWLANVSSVILQQVLLN